MRAVLDTNVIVSATLIRGGNEDKILRAWQRGTVELVVSPAILEEIGRVFSYEKPRRFRWMTDDEVVVMLEALAQEGVVVPGTTVAKVSRDPDDNKSLSAAEEAGARYVVTGQGPPGFEGASWGKGDQTGRVPADTQWVDRQARMMQLDVSDTLMYGSRRRSTGEPGPGPYRS